MRYEIEDGYVLDVGQNISGLGYAYLFFRFVWPVIIGLAAITVTGVGLAYFLEFAVRHPIPFLPTQ